MVLELGNMRVLFSVGGHEVASHAHPPQKKKKKKKKKTHTHTHAHYDLRVLQGDFYSWFVENYEFPNVNEDINKVDKTVASRPGRIPRHVPDGRPGSCNVSHTRRTRARMLQALNISTPL